MQLVLDGCGIFQECATKGPELDPELVVALARIYMARAIWHKMPDAEDLCLEIWANYRAQGHPAANVLAPFQIAPAPPPGGRERRGWKKGMPNWGPVGLLLQSARVYGLGIVLTGEGWKVCQRNELVLSTCAEPPQTVRPRIHDMLQRARMAQV